MTAEKLPAGPGNLSTGVEDIIHEMGEAAKNVPSKVDVSRAFVESAMELIRLRLNSIKPYAIRGARDS